MGDANTPTDADSDGKIDAAEGATGDADEDCIPDQDDANDAYSDASSEANPLACGDDSPYIDPSGATCDSVAPRLRASCMRPLIEAVVDCYDPMGCARGESDATEDSGRIVFENGAAWEQDPDGETVRFYSSTGRLCASALLTQEGDTVSVAEYTVSGARYVLTFDEPQDAVRTVQCPGGGTVHLTPTDNAGLSACQEVEFEFCEGGFPGSCQGDSDCTGGDVCCAVSDVSVCVQADACPQ